jgi:hypothetical protein
MNDELALALGRRLIATGYEDYHVVRFTEDGYGLQHPIECRPDLIGCMFNEWLASQPGPDMDPGRYRMDWRSKGPKYTALNPDAPTEPPGGAS